jgi:thiamine phosphate synthase YjbQ (UPF0047 family)
MLRLPWTPSSVTRGKDDRERLQHAVRAAFLGRTLVAGVNNDDLTLAVIFAELDGPRRREITIQVIGERGHRGTERTNAG